MGLRQSIVRWSAAALAISSPGLVLAVPSGGTTFQSGSAIFTLTPDTTPGSAYPHVTKTITAIPFYLDMPTAPYQFDPLDPVPSLRAIHQPPASPNAYPNTRATATASVGYTGGITNTSSATVKLSAGTGTGQSNPAVAGNNPAKAYAGPTALRIDVDFLWNTDAVAGFGPNASGALSTSVGGILGPLGEATFTANLTFYDRLGGIDTVAAALTVPVTTRTNPSSTSSLAFSFPVSMTKYLNGAAKSIAAGHQLRLVGDFTITAKNDEGPSSAVFRNFELGGAPPTSTWDAAGGGGNYSNAANWYQHFNADEPGPQPAVPNGPGFRARFINGMSTINPGVVVTNDQAATTLGEIDFDNDVGYTLLGNPVHLDQTDIAVGPQNSAVINVMSNYGSAGHTIAAPLVLHDSLVVVVDSAGGLTLAGGISEVGGPRAITKFGAAPLTLGGLSSYTGATTISEGSLTVGTGGTTGDLGSGPVTDNATLAFNRSNAITVSNAIGGAGVVRQIGSGALTLNGVQSWGPTAVLRAEAGTTQVSSDPGSESAYNLAVHVTPAAGGATLHITANTGDLVHLRELKVNDLSIGGDGLLIIDAATSGSAPNPITGFGALGGSVAVYLGNGTGGIGTPPRAMLENLWKSATSEGYWALQNGVVTSISRGVTLAAGVVTDTSKNGLVLLPSFDNALNNVLYLGEDVQGDTNGDGAVDISDLGIILQHINSSPGAVSGEAGYTIYTPGEGDVNGDGGVDIGDLGIVLGNSGQTYNPALSGGGVNSIPEPANVALLALGGMALLRRRRGSR